MCVSVRFYRNNWASQLTATHTRTQTNCATTAHNSYSLTKRISHTNSVCRRERRGRLRCCQPFFCGCFFAAVLLVVTYSRMQSSTRQTLPPPRPPFQLYYAFVVVVIVVAIFPRGVCVNLLVCFAVQNAVTALNLSRLSAWRIFAFIDAVNSNTHTTHTHTHMLPI